LQLKRQSLKVILHILVSTPESPESKHGVN